MFSQEAMVSATIGALVGGLCSLGITSWQLRRAHRNALELMQRQDFAKACAIFRSAFVDVLIFCKEQPTGIGGERDIADVLATAIGGHEKAMLLFRAYLPMGQQAGFDRAWNDYSRQDKWNELNRNPIFLEYAAVFNVTKEKENRHLALLRIEKLLDFAPTGRRDRWSG